MSAYPSISKNIVFHKVNESDQYLLKFNGRVLYVSDFLYLIITALANRNPIDYIVEDINNSQRFSRAITRADLEQIIQTHLLPLNLSDASPAADLPQDHEVKHRIALLRFEQLRWVLNHSRRLFNPRVFTSLLLLAICCSTYYLFGCGRQALLADGGTAFHLGFFGITMLLVLAHEIGHASAAYYFGIVPKEIGIGIYFFVPVFYADVTDTWQLAPRHRIIVNLAGVFAQLLANVLFIAAALLSTTPMIKTLMHQLIMFNLLSVIANLNPFFKFDGYWVYADYFKLPTLRIASGQYIRQSFNALCYGAPVPKAGLALAIYSAGKVAFIIWGCSQIYQLLPTFLVEAYTFARTSMAGLLFDDVFFFKAARYLFGVAIVVYMFFGLAKAIIRFLKNTFFSRQKSEPSPLPD